MIRMLLLTSIVLAIPFLSQSQVGATKSGDNPILQKNDSIILADMIIPMVTDALNSGATPDWQVLGESVSVKYGENYVDRSVTKAKIYFYFGKDWPMFCQALIHYTEAYENKDELKLMNKNAKMVLQYSQKPEELKTALTWIKHAVDKEPGNSVYKETYDGLNGKIKELAAKK